MSEQFINEIETGNKPRSKPQHFEPERKIDDAYLKPRKPKRTYSKSQARLISIGLTVLGLALMVGATIGIALLLEEIFPQEKTTLADLNQRSGKMILWSPVAGIIMILTGLVATLRREINMGQFLNVGDEYEFSGPAAFVMGLSWMASGVLLLGSGLTFLDF